jgi:hypothetical protein
MKSQTDILKERIAFLESQKAFELANLKEQMQENLVLLKPVNILKNTLKDLSSSPDLGKNLINNAIGLTTGYISKKIILGTSHNPVTRILGNMLEFTIGNYVAKNSETIKAVAEVLLNKISRRFIKTEHEFKKIDT